MTAPFLSPAAMAEQQPRTPPSSRRLGQLQQHPRRPSPSGRISSAQSQALLDSSAPSSTKSSSPRAAGLLQARPHPAGHLQQQLLHGQPSSGLGRSQQRPPALPIGRPSTPPPCAHPPQPVPGSLSSTCRSSRISPTSMQHNSSRNSEEQPITAADDSPSSEIAPVAFQCECLFLLLSLFIK